MAHQPKYSPEVRERAVRMMFEHESEYDSQWEAIRSLAAKIGCTAETLRKWVRRKEIDTGRRNGVTRDERARIKELELENQERGSTIIRPKITVAERQCAGIRMRKNGPEKKG
jgi:transposase-like protein